MGVTHAFAVWLLLRLLAGVASAWILVHVSAWALERLHRLRRADLQGVVYAGVGLGIAGAGLLSLLLTTAVWFAFRNGARVGNPPANAVPPARRAPWTADKLRVALCYGALGIGYIIPATFLPAMARHYLGNPAVFGWAWPVFGTAAALSTWIVSRWLHGVDNRRLWAVSYWLMALGVALPSVWPALSAILVAALLVGGTFMVVTMAGLREARAVAGDQATGFIAAITAVFATGQVIGPLIVSAFAGFRHGFAAALLLASVLLAFAAVALWRSAAEQPSRG